MKTEKYFLANGDVIERPYEPDDTFILRQGTFVSFQVKDNVIFVWNDNDWYEVNKADAVNNILHQLQLALYHLINISNHDTINIHKLVNAANAIDDVKKDAVDSFNWGDTCW